MTEAVPEEAVAVSLLLGVLSLLDQPRHSKAAEYLRSAIETVREIDSESPKRD
jgi:hypothetical protein